LTIILTLDTRYLNRPGAELRTNADQATTSAPRRILASRREHKTCVAHQYSIVKDHWLRQKPRLSTLVGF
jgi:hypothetical protein